MAITTGLKLLSTLAGATGLTAASTYIRIHASELPHKYACLCAKVIGGQEPPFPARVYPGLKWVFVDFIGSCAAIRIFSATFSQVYANRANPKAPGIAQTMGQVAAKDALVVGGVAGTALKAGADIVVPPVKDAGIGLGEKFFPNVARKIQRVNDVYQFITSIKAKHLLTGGIVAGVAGYGLYKLIKPNHRLIKTNIHTKNATSSMKATNAPSEPVTQHDQIIAAVIQELRNIREELEIQKLQAAQEKKGAPNSQMAAQPIHFHYHQDGSTLNTDEKTKEASKPDLSKENLTLQGDK